MRKDFILDFETIGNCAYINPVIDCSYYIFDWDRFTSNPYTFLELTGKIQKTKVSVEDQVNNYDFSYSKNDLSWWMSQPKEVRKNIKPLPTDLKAEAFIDKMISYLKENDKVSYWWSRSNGFDPVLLDRLARVTNRNDMLNAYIPYWAVRDTRTYIDAKFNFTTKNGFCPVSDEDWWNNNFMAHDSTHDVAADILRLQAITRAENDLEQVQR